MTIAGRAGRTLADEWAGVRRAYLGPTVPDFPNLFLLYGPNSRDGTVSVVYPIEAGIRHVPAALDEMRRSAAYAFDRELRAALSRTVWHTGCRTGTSMTTATTPASGRRPGGPTAGAPRASS